MAAGNMIVKEKAQNENQQWSNHNPSTKTYNQDLGCDTEMKRKFYVVDALFILASLFTYIADIITDILVALQYSLAGQYLWSSFTLFLVILPSLVIQLISFRWYISDGYKNIGKIFCIHLFQLQPLERYFKALLSGFQARSSRDESQVEYYYYQQNDVCMLRLFEAFLESAPQLTLQLYIIIITQQPHWLTVTSACFSLVALGWAVTSYNHALRRAYKENYRVHWGGLVLQTCWHIGMVAARVCVLVIFTIIYGKWLGLVIGLHWLIMTIWILTQKTDFCPTFWEEKLFNVMVGLIYCFCFFSLKEGQTRRKMTFFYGFIFIENVMLLAASCPYIDRNWFTYAILGTILVSYVFGLFCMLVYYRFCHPSGVIYCCQKLESPGEIMEKIENEESSKNQPVQKFVGNGLSSASLRRALLKPQNSRVTINFQEIHTPSTVRSPALSTIKEKDGTLSLNDNSVFQHYSVDASACLQQQRDHGATLDFSGIDLSMAPRNNATQQFNMPSYEKMMSIQEIDCSSPCEESIQDNFFPTSEEMVESDIPIPSPRRNQNAPVPAPRRKYSAPIPSPRKTLSHSFPVPTTIETTQDFDSFDGDSFKSAENNPPSLVSSPARDDKSCEEINYRRNNFSTPIKPRGFLFCSPPDLTPVPSQQRDMHVDGGVLTGKLDFSHYDNNDSLNFI